jgi:hypothetical protein
MCHPLTRLYNSLESNGVEVQIQILYHFIIKRLS